MRAKVLTAISDFGLEAVLAAVERVLESDRLRVEHVLNVLARLRKGPPPRGVETALTVEIIPLADPQRYDTRRTEVSHD